MPLLEFSQLTYEQAAALAGAVAATGPARLAELGGWLRSSGGPLQEMDASVDSLVPLWVWFLERLDGGLPEVPADARPMNYVPAPDDEQVRAAFPRLYAAETLAHYAAAVLRRLDPESGWGVHPQGERFPLYEAHQVGLRSGDRVWSTYITAMGKVAKAESGNVRARRPDDLRRSFLDWLPEATGVPARQERTGPLPELLVDPPPVVEPPALAFLQPRVPAPRDPEPAPEPGGRPLVEHELHLLDGPDDGLDDPGLLRPLDAGRVRRWLVGIGAVDMDGQPPSRLDLDDTVEFVLEDGPLSVGFDTYPVDGTLRHLEVEVITGEDHPLAVPVVQSLYDLAAELGARIVITDR